MQAGADVRQATRHRNKTTNFSTSCHRRTVRRNKPSFVSSVNVAFLLDKEHQLHMILIIFKTIASTILADSEKFLRNASRSAHSRAAAHRARRIVFNGRNNREGDRCAPTMPRNENVVDWHRANVRNRVFRHCGSLRRSHGAHRSSMGALRPLAHRTATNIGCRACGE